MSESDVLTLLEVQVHNNLGCDAGTGELTEEF
jgi:hypothetical protein